MTLQFPVVNRSIPGLRDKAGQFLIELKDALVSTGLFRVTGSGDGLATFQNEGQTAGEGGSFDIFTAQPPYWGGVNLLSEGRARSISRAYAWFQLRELSSSRVFQFRRYYYNDSSGSYSENVGICICPQGVAASGATPTKAPQSIGPKWWYCADPSAGNGNTDAYDARLGMNGVMLSSSADETIWHLAVATEPRAQGVCPFFVWYINRTKSMVGGGFFYESLTDAPADNTDPYVLHCAQDWGQSFGWLNNESYGPWWNIQAVVTGRNPIVGCAFDRVNSPAFTYSYPGKAFAPLSSDGKWRTFRPRVRNASGQYVGRCEHIQANMVNRDYPTTYALGSSQPLITVGHMLLPWKQNAVPLWGI